ncbi:MAG: FAD binding domain-containing protein [Treponema sp.]|nr:FAD binding domain-containing protein [Candidatus Treponema equifaecale]
MSSSKSFFYAKTLQEVFYQMKTINGLSVHGGCTDFAIHQKEFPENNLSIRNIEELKVLEKRERYFEIGSAVTLAEIEELGQSNLPTTLYEAIKSIKNLNVRNMATIGGNICSPFFYNTLYAPLLALNARLEFQREQETIYMSMSKFEGVPENSILTKIRIPYEEWEISIFKRLGPADYMNEFSGSFVFLANSQKNQISNIRIAFAGKFKFQDPELENKLIGAHLPLSGTTISEFVLEAEEAFNNVAENAHANPILKKQFWNLINYSLEQLT